MHISFCWFCHAAAQFGLTSAKSMSRSKFCQDKSFEAALKTGSHDNRGMITHMGRVKQIWYLSPMRAAKVQASLRTRAVSPEPPLLAHTSSDSRGTFRQQARSMAPLNGWTCAVKICHYGMLEDTNSLDAAHTYLYCQ